MSGGTRHSSSVSPGGHRTRGDGQHSDNGTNGIKSHAQSNNHFFFNYTVMLFINRTSYM